MSSTIDTDEREDSLPLTAGLAAGAIGAAALGAVAVAGYRYFKHSDDVLISNELEAIIERDRQAIEGTPDPEMQARRRYLELIHSGSMDQRSAAHLLGISEEDVVRRIEAGQLYAIPFAGQWRIPAMQFEGRRPVRGLDRVLPVLRKDLHPLEVVNWLMLANDALTVEGRAVSPLQWLRAGWDAARVASLGRSVGSIV